MGKSCANERNEKLAFKLPSAANFIKKKKDGMILEKRKKHNIIMNNFKDIKSSSNRNRLSLSEYSYAIVSAPSRNCSRCIL